jgi:hypothetical protein
MLLNRAMDEEFSQEGIYVAFATSLDDPRAWSDPVRILKGGSWYPQVMGLEPGVGSDKEAGERARFFMKGRSDYWITFAFEEPEQADPPVRPIDRDRSARPDRRSAG